MEKRKHCRCRYKPAIAIYRIPLRSHWNIKLKRAKSSKLCDESRNAVEMITILFFQSSGNLSHQLHVVFVSGNDSHNFAGSLNINHHRENELLKCASDCRKRRKATDKKCQRIEIHRVDAQESRPDCAAWHRQCCFKN